MAGFSNSKYLAPSHFTKPDKNIVGKDATDSAKCVLLPPSTYEYVDTNAKLRNDNGNLEQNAGKNCEIPGQRKEEEIIPISERLQFELQFLDEELQKAKLKITELEQEKTILQDNVQDTQALSQLVRELKKDLKTSKDKLNEGKKNASDRTDEYLDVISSLR